MSAPARRHGPQPRQAAAAGTPAATPALQSATTASGTIPNGSCTVSLRGGVLAVGAGSGHVSPLFARPGLRAVGSACADGATYCHEVAGNGEGRRPRSE